MRNRNRAALAFLLWLGVLSFPPRGSVYGQASPASLTAFRAYTASVETGLRDRHRSPAHFVLLTDPGVALPAPGQILLERLSPTGGVPFPGSLLHHWRATMFLPGVGSAALERLLHDVPRYPERFAPEILQAKVLRESGPEMEAVLRVRQKHVLTVVLDTTYNIETGRLDARHGYSTSRSLRIDEIASPGTPEEHVLSPAQEHGFLWRQNTYWSYEERSGGLLVQVESLSLSRSIPAGLGWAVRPFVESIPRESLHFTLQRVAEALGNK